MQLQVHLINDGKYYPKNQETNSTQGRQSYDEITYTAEYITNFTTLKFKPPHHKTDATLPHCTAKEICWNR